MIPFQGFEWDEGNSSKNWLKHGVSRSECEEVFLNEPILIIDSPMRIPPEHRLMALGMTDSDRRIAVIFTLRKGMIRVVSARPMSRKERKKYEEQSAEDGA